jgi:hypothetical protein
MTEENTTNTTDTPTSVVNSDGSFTENWTERFDEGDREHLSRYKSLDELGKSHMNLTRKYGKDPNTMVEIPSETSSDEVRAAFRKAKGAPDTVDAYEYTLSDEMVVKLGPLDDKKMAAFREFAHQQEWSPKQFKDALDFYHANIASDIDAADVAFEEQRKEAQEKGVAALKKEWRGEYDNRVLRANAVLRKYGGEEAVAEFNAQNSPLMTNFLDNVAEAMSEDTLKGIVSSDGATATNIKAQIADVREQMDTIIKENPVNFKVNPKYKVLEERKKSLYKQMSA